VYKDNISGLILCSYTTVILST